MGTQHPQSSPSIRSISVVLVVFRRRLEHATCRHPLARPLMSREFTKQGVLYMLGATPGPERGVVAPT